MSILVTGGGGFVGSNFVQLLLKHHEDNRVVVLDPLLYPIAEKNFPEEVRENSRFNLVQGSVTDRDCLQSLLSEGDTIVHLAVETGRLDQFIDTQLKGTKTLLDVAVKKKVRRVVYQSTCDVYGINESSDLTENDPVRATHLYAATKLGAEALVTAYYHTYGLPISIVRPVSIYGPRQYPGWLVARFINLAIAGEPLPIFGSGEACRDWIHVDDICRGLLAAMESPVEGECFNLGTGREWSVLEIARKLLAMTGKSDANLTFLPERPGDFKRQVTSAAKARDILGWQPQVSFESGLRSTFDWYRQNQGWVAVQVARDSEVLGFRVTES